MHVSESDRSEFPGQTDAKPPGKIQELHQTETRHEEEVRGSLRADSLRGHCELFEIVFDDILD